MTTTVETPRADSVETTCETPIARRRGRLVAVATAAIVALAGTVSLAVVLLDDDPNPSSSRAFTEHAQLHAADEQVTPAAGEPFVEHAGLHVDEASPTTPTFSEHGRLHAAGQ